MADTVADAQTSPDTEQPYAELGLKSEEYGRIREILQRRPTSCELAMYSVMWSEHCSYKSSKVHLKYFGETTTDEMRAGMLAGIGENAAMVREMVLARLALLGFKIDKEANNAAVLGGEGPITVEGSRLALVMPTNEELVIARDALSLVG